MKMRTFSAIIVLFALMAIPVFGNAAIVTFSGQDDNAYPGPWPNSAAAQASFTAAAGVLGLLNTITFENQPLGFRTPFTAAPGVTVSLNCPNYGNGWSGISATTYGLLYGFNTTTSGSNWLGFPVGSATFTFANPTQSFGMYLTGLQTGLTSPGNLTVSFNDGAPQSFALPVNVNGGAQYWGFTDAGKLIASITITDQDNDAWGIDDVTYNHSAVPVPPAVWLFGSGLLGLAGWRRLKKG